MESHLPFLRTLPLFRGLDDAEIRQLLACCNAREQQFEKNQIVWDPMAKLPYLAMILEGELSIQQEDWRGNRTILDDFGPGDYFGETLLGPVEGMLPFFICVRSKTKTLLLEYGEAMKPCSKHCKGHVYLLRNMVEALTQKEMRLLHKIEYLSRRTTREKLMAYFTVQSVRSGSRRITVPYTRQELADFLSVDRSAMCTELTRMQSDGLIRYDRRYFELLDVS